MLQAIGNCFMPLVFLMISCGTNIVLDLLLIGGTSLGIRGAAVATVLAQSLSVVLCLIYMARKCELLIPGREDFTKDGRLYRELLAQGLSVGFMGAIVGPFYAVLGVVLATRYALQGLGNKILPLLSSVIELFGKIIFVLLFIPCFQYLAVIFCEPVIWCFMAVELVIAFYRNPYIRSATKR